MKTLADILSPPEDDRSISEWMADQGLDYVTSQKPAGGKTKLEKVKWLGKGQRTRKHPNYDLRLARTVITFKPHAVKVIGATHLEIGTAQLKNEPVMVVRPAGKNEDGYKLSSNHRLISPSVPTRLLAAGLKTGSYKLYKCCSGAYMAKWIKG